MKLLATVILALLTTPLFGQANAVINGPTEAKPGTLVILTTVGSVGDNFVWKLPEGLQVASCNTNEQIFFAVGDAGIYRFMLIAADKEANISYTEHIVTIGQPPPEKPGPGPEPEPAPDLNNLTGLSRDEAAKVNDPDTQKLIKQWVTQTHTNIEALCGTSQCPSLEEAQQQYQQTIQNALATRPRGSQTNWVPWRQAINGAITLIAPTTVEQLQTIMLAVVKEL